MSLQEIETAIAALPPGELDALMEWIEEYRADAWDRQIEQDAEAGRLDAIIADAKQEVKTGRYHRIGPDTSLVP